MQSDPVRSYEVARRRLFFAFGLLVLVTAVGSGGYWYLSQSLGGGTWTVEDCIYMTAITINGHSSWRDRRPIAEQYSAMRELASLWCLHNLLWNSAI